MLEPSDIELIRAIIREELQRLIRPKTAHAERQRRYRERKKRDKSDVTRHSDVTCDASPSKNSVTRDKSDVTRQVPLMVPPIPSSLIPPKKNKIDYARVTKIPVSEPLDSSNRTSADLFGDNTRTNGQSDPGTNPGHAKRSKPGRKPANYEELKEHCLSLGLTEEDAVCLWEHWIGNGFTRSGKPINNWKAVASVWERRNIFFPSKQVEKYKK